MPTQKLPTIEDLDVAGKRVFVRCDLNVPLKDGEIVDDLRIRAAVPTLQALLDKGALLLVASHLGRPKGVEESLRLRPVAHRLEQLLGRPVEAMDEVIGPDVSAAAISLADVVLLENLRFEPGETMNDPAFADRLAVLADCYVNDAFGAAHRAHASVVGLAERLPSAAGLLLHDEVEKMEAILHSPERPFVAILGGAKVSDKLAVIGNLLDRVDTICIGGAMAFTLLVARGEEVGSSLVERDRIEEVQEILRRAEELEVEILLPTDVVAAESIDDGAQHATVPLSQIGDRIGVDIGPDTSAAFADVIKNARSVLWNGPMGIFERAAYAGGTEAVAHAVVRATRDGAYSVVGGGDSAAALAQLGLTEGVSHLSTGGGASLELLEGKELPGIAVLKQKGSSA
ncbi:MAG: phosphoglycerate kinase [Actinomycetota bacterium]